MSSKKPSSKSAGHPRKPLSGQITPPAPAAADRFAKVPTIAFVSLLCLVCIVFFNKVIFGTANFWEDLLYQELPHRLFARDSLLHGIFPHWNPYTFGGMPFFAATHTGVLYPTNLVLSFLPLGKGTFWYALELSIILHLFIAGVAMFFLCTYLSRSRGSSLFASISYMLCGFFVVHIIHSLMVYILAWLPLLVLLLVRGVQKDRPKDFLFAGLILGVSIFAGHPQITFYEFLFLGAFAAYLVVCVSSKRLSHGLQLLAVFGIAGGIAMVLLLPAAELSTESARATWTFQMASEGSMSFRQLTTFVIPKLFGGTTSPNPWRRELSFWLNDSYHSGYWTFWETTFYTGLGVFIFGLVQLINIRRSRFVLFCGIWLAASLAVALGSNFPLYKPLFDYIPGFGQFRVPARILFTWNLLLPVLAAQTIDDMRNPDARKRYLRPLAAGGGICLLVGIIVSSGFIVNFIPELSETVFREYAVKQSNITLAILSLCAVATVLYYRSILKFRVFTAVILGALCIDLFVFGIDYHVVPYGATDYFSRNRELADYLSNENKKEPFRTKMREGGVMLLDRNQGMIDKIQLMEGYNPLNLRRRTPPLAPQAFLDCFNVKYAIRIDSARGDAGLVDNPTRFPRARMFYNATVIADDSLAGQFMKSPGFNYRTSLVLNEKPAIDLPGDASGAANDVSITRYENNRIELSASTEKNGILWLSEIWYPAWKVFVDGKEAPLLRADYSFRAVALPKGEHRVVFEYRSKAFARGALVSLLTLALTVGAIVFFSVKRNRIAP